MTPFGITVSGVPLRQYPVPGGAIAYDPQAPNFDLYQASLAAKYFGLNLVDWYNLEPEIRAVHMASYLAQTRQEAAEAEDWRRNHPPKVN